MFLRFLLHAPRLTLCCAHRQNVFLSQSHISLGNIPVQTKCSRLLFLNNISKSETIVFTWQPRALDFGEVRVLGSHNQSLWPGSRPVLYCPVSSHPVLSHPILASHITFHHAPSHPSSPTPSHPVVFHCISSRPILSHPTLPCKSLPRPILCILPPQSPRLSLNQQVSVSPMEGEVAPEEATPILVTLKASVHASFYSMDLICKVGTSDRETRGG